MDNLQLPALTVCPTKAGLVAGTTTTYSITANPLNYVLRSKWYSKATVTNGATPTTDANTGLAFTPIAFPASALVGGQGSVFVFGYDAAGNIKVAQGSVEQLDVAGKFVNAPKFPNLLDTITPFGYLVVTLGATAVANWTFGTNNLSGVTGVTYAFQDVFVLPDRPQVS
jgi:hypothetical protein